MRVHDVVTVGGVLHGDAVASFMSYGDRLETLNLVQRERRLLQAAAARGMV